MGRKKSVPGPLTLMQREPSAVPVPPLASASTGTSQTGIVVGTGLGIGTTHGAGPGHGHSVKGTLAAGETQRLSPSTASLSVSSAPSMSPKSPRFPYTSRFSPKNLTSSSPKSPAQSQSRFQPHQQLQQQQQQQQQPPPPQTRPTPSHPQSTQRKTGPQREHIPSKTSAHPGSYPQYHSQPQLNPTSRSQQRQALVQLQQSNLGSQDSQSPTSTSTSTSSDAKQPHIAELQQRFPPITRAVTASSHQQSKQHQQVERRLKSSHGRRHGEDKPASDSDNAQLQSQNHKQGFFFNFSKSAKSSDRPLQSAPAPAPAQEPPEPQAAPAQAQAQPQPQPTRVAMNATDQPSITKQSSKQSDTAHAPAPSLPSKPETLLGDGDPDSNPASTTKKASKPKPFTLLSRTKSHREKNGRSPRHTPSPQDTKEPVPPPRATAARVPIMELNPTDKAPVAQPPRTATVAHDAAYREAISSNSRTHSADRAQSRDASSDRRGHQEKDQYSRAHQSAPRDGNGASSFFNNLRREGGRVAETIGKGLFGKGGRSGSTTERDPVDDEHYVLKVINLPLVEQTRLTRISKRLEESRDKTEFWMPAFPWRAIDYLNYKGCDVEGLYRVPGSGPQIKKWQRRFDEQHDVDLFTQEDLYDINIIGSMLKAWLRELPDELFPKEAQDRINRECAGSETVPQLLVDELSNLSPFNYYLLFAITCHLSLLLAHSDKNKMDFRNLCICFQPCMKIDAFCFKFLVCDWRDCWKGCRTEARYIEEEYKLFDQPPPPGLGIKKRLEPRVEGRPERRPSPVPDRDDRERNLSSADSNGKKSQHSGEQARLKKKSPPSQDSTRENGTAVPRSAQPESNTVNSPRGPNDTRTNPQDAKDMRPLSPIKPLSPLGF